MFNGVPESTVRREKKLISSKEKYLHKEIILHAQVSDLKQSEIIILCAQEKHYQFLHQGASQLSEVFFQ